jgi:hypothetical protein
MSSVGRELLKKRILLSLVLIVGACSLVAVFVGGTLGRVIGAGGAGLSIATAVWQYRLSPQHVRSFTGQDWEKFGNEWVLLVSAREHGRGDTPLVDTLVRAPDGSLEHADFDLSVTETGDVKIAAAASNPPPEGQIRIM